MKKRPRDPDQMPAQGPDYFARAKRLPEGLAGLPAVIDAIRKRRGKQKAPTKQLVSLRLSPEVLAAYRSTGRGWQTRIDDDLRKLTKRRKIAAA